MGMGISGIGGFNTEGIVQKLMALEWQAGKGLQTKKVQLESRTKAFRDLNTQLAALTKNAWSVYGKESKFDKSLNASAVWGAVKGSSSSEMVSVSTKAGAAVGSVEFDIKSLAQSKQVTFDSNQLTELTNAIGQGGSFSIMVGNKVTNITPASNSMQDIAKAINSVKDSGVAATVVRVSDSNGQAQYVLQVTGKETGAEAGDFKIFAGDVTKGLSVTPKTTTPDAASQSVSYTFDDAAALRSAVSGVTSYDGTVRRASSDAIISLYGEDHQYSSNQIELMDKVTVDISGVKAETKADGTSVYPGYLTKGVKIDVVADQSEAAGKVKSLIGDVNKILGTLAKGMKSVEQTRTDEDGRKSTWKAPGVLSNSIGRQVQSELGDMLSSGITIKDAAGNAQTYSAEDFGIVLKNSSDGLKVEFDESKFQAMMESDPTRTEKVVSAFAEKLGDFGSNISDSSTGMLTSVIKSNDDEKSYVESRISDFTERMVRKEASLKQQYSRLETLLAGFSQQQAWLTSQLAGLPR